MDGGTVARGGEVREEEAEDNTLLHPSLPVSPEEEQSSTDPAVPGL